MSAEHAVIRHKGEILLFKFAGSPWGKAKIRKPATCSLCPTRLEVGSIAFRPLNNGKYRMKRICTSCAQDLTKHD